MAACIWATAGPTTHGNPEPHCSQASDLVHSSAAALGTGAIGGRSNRLELSNRTMGIGRRGSAERCRRQHDHRVREGGNSAVTTNIDRLGTFTGRLGFAFDRFQIYGKGGAAVAHSHFGMVPFPPAPKAQSGTGPDPGPDEPDRPPMPGAAAHPLSTTGSTGAPRSGAGPPVPVSNSAFSPALSAFAEYDFLDFGSQNFSMTGTRMVLRSPSASRSPFI